MTYTSFPFENADTTETQYSYLMREFQDPGVVGSLGSTALAVSATSGLTLSIATGRLVVRGFMLSVTAAETLTLAAADANPRIDRVVARVDPTANAITLAILKGTAAATPAAPALTQTDTGVWEFPLASVAVAAGAVTIVTANITDERRFVSGRSGRWTTATRPTAPSKWDRGLNESLGYVEVWNGTAWAPEPASAAALVGTLDPVRVADGTVPPAKLTKAFQAGIATAAVGGTGVVTVVTALPWVGANAYAITAARLVSGGSGGPDDPGRTGVTNVAASGSNTLQFSIVWRPDGSPPGYPALSLMWSAVRI